MHNDYRLMNPQPTEPLEACPCCGNAARVWEFSESPRDPVQRVVMCDNSGSIGPRGDDLVNEGCLLQMPPQDFYCGTGRDAARYWNEYAKALTATQRANRWSAARVLRDSINGAPNLPRCAHGSALIDGGGELLVPPCGCKAG